MYLILLHHQKEIIRSQYTIQRRLSEDSCNDEWCRNVISNLKNCLNWSIIFLVILVIGLFYFLMMSTLNPTLYRDIFTSVAVSISFICMLILITHIKQYLLDLNYIDNIDVYMATPSCSETCRTYIPELKDLRQQYDRVSLVYTIYFWVSIVSMIAIVIWGVRIFLIGKNTFNVLFDRYKMHWYSHIPQTDQKRYYANLSQESTCPICINDISEGYGMIVQSNPFGTPSDHLCSMRTVYCKECSDNIIRTTNKQLSEYLQNFIHHNHEIDISNIRFQDVFENIMNIRFLWAPPECSRKTTDRAIKKGFVSILYRPNDDVQIQIAPLLRNKVD